MSKQSLVSCHRRSAVLNDHPDATFMARPDISIVSWKQSRRFRKHDYEVGPGFGSQN